MLLKVISLQLKKLKTSSLLHFNAIDIRAKLVIGQAFFDKKLPAFSSYKIKILTTVSTLNLINL